MTKVIFGRTHANKNVMLISPANVFETQDQESIRLQLKANSLYQAIHHKHHYKGDKGAE